MEKYTLSELIVIKNGRDHKDLPNGDYPVFGSGGIMRYVNKYIYDKPSILLPRKGTLNNIQYCDKPFWTVDTLYYSEVNEELACPYYLYRLLSLLDLSRLDSGTGVPSMTFDSYYNIKVWLPKIEEQRCIASVLQELDAKIELNRQINDNLEAMAKLLYNYWFVQFDFPNEEGKPYKSSGGAMVWNEKLKRKIPQGWIASNYTDLFTIGNGQTMPQNEGFIPAYGGNGIVKMVEISNYPACIIIGRVGANCGSIHYSKVPCWVSDNAISVCSKNDDWQPFLFYSFRLYNLSKNKGGSSQPLITHEALKHLYFPMSEKHINQFCHIVNELQDLIYSNQQEILKLTKLRDELLPLLMNGQATVNYHLSVFLRQTQPTISLPQKQHIMPDTLTFTSVHYIPGTLVSSAFTTKTSPLKIVKNGFYPCKIKRYL